MQKELLHKEKAKKESELRELAMKARMEKSGAVGMASRMDAGGGFREDKIMGCLGQGQGQLVLV